MSEEQTLHSRVDNVVAVEVVSPASTVQGVHDHLFLPCLSRHTQSGTWSSSGKRVWFTESHMYLIISFVYLLIYLLIYSLVQRIVVLYKVTSKSRFVHITYSLALTHIALIHDCSSPSTASVSYRLPAVISFKCRPVPPHPSHPSLMVPEHMLPAQIYNTCHTPFVTDASKTY